MDWLKYPSFNSEDSNKRIGAEAGKIWALSTCAIKLFNNGSGVANVFAVFSNQQSFSHTGHTGYSGHLCTV